MKTVKTSALLAVDGKGRVHLPAALRKELGIKQEVLVERQGAALLLRPLAPLGDPVAFLSSIRIKTTQTPIQMKREAEEVFGV